MLYNRDIFRKYRRIVLTSVDGTSVTPLKANFWHSPGFAGEIKL